MFVTCSHVLMVYGAAAHIDAFDPQFTAGFRVDHLPYERYGDNQLFFPELQLSPRFTADDPQQFSTGVIVEQSKSCITLYQGGKLKHTNSIIDVITIDGHDVYAPGIALVQKKGLLIRDGLRRSICKRFLLSGVGLGSSGVFAIGFNSRPMYTSPLPPPEP
jgi:hypothetical protein